MKRVSKNSRTVLLLVEDWRRPFMPISGFKQCFNGKGVNVLHASAIKFETAKEIVAKKRKGSNAAK